MSKFKVEIQITVLAIIIGIVVATIGYFSYERLSKIVNYIQQVTYPDNKIFVIKEIESDLNALENTVRLYALTNNYDVLEDFYANEDEISKNLKKLAGVKVENKYDLMLIDSISGLSQEKLDLWNEILNIHLSKKGFFPAFSKLYSNLDEIKTDSVAVDSQNTGAAEIIGDSNETTADTSISGTSIERKTIKKKIQKLEWEIYRNSKKKNVLETQLIEKNVVISKNIKLLISEAETRSENALLQKTVEADRLAKLTYKRLAQFVVSAVALLFVALFVLFNYLRKARTVERALTNAREKAETLAHAKEQFAANVSHELRTPVNAIYGLTEQVLQKKLDSNTAEIVTIIFKSAAHLKSIINDTLDFSKIQSGKLITESENFSPFTIIDEVYQLFKYEATEKGIALKLDWVGENHPILIGDPLRLKQIMINLTGNAIKFTKEGEVIIKVKCSENSNNKVELQIQVIDTGIGIDEKKINVVFDEYVQIEDRTGKKYHGTGLGLTIVKKLVEHQNGKIKLESIQGFGTNVTVNLVYPKGEQLKPEQETNGFSEIPESFKQLSVLIADDEEYNRFLLKNILQKWNIKFKEVINGNDAVNATCNEHFDIVLMDINMPEMNGIEATKEIFRCDPDINIIAVTAVTEQLDQKACFDAGMKGFLFKPFSEKDLFEAINSLTEKKMNSGPATSQKQPVDISELHRLAGNDEKFLIEMIQLFIKSMEKGISGIEVDIKKGNKNGIYENAHKMAAPVKHIGASHLYENIKLLEKQSKQSAEIKTIEPVFQEIKTEIKEINKILKLHLNDLKT
jgi:signal transduction histidine kinase/CheY-like chemotaxis protein/CHASE3 domain sensor protein/HPt (histidine-containing phosphotransfer) domain-containing protein